MLSNKMTFSLTCFVVLIVFGLVYSVPSVFADGRNDDNDGRVYDLNVTISAAESMIDVSAVDHPDIDDIQIATGRDRASRVIHNVGQGADTDPDTLTISLLVEFSHVVNLAEPGARIPLEDIDETIDNEPKPSGGDFGADDLYVAAYDKEGRSLGVLSLAEASAAGTSISQFRDTGGPGKLFLVRIDESQLRNAYIGRGVASGYEIYSLVFFIPRGTGNAPWEDDNSTGDATVSRGIRKYDRAHAIAHFGPKAHQHLNNASNEFQVDLVDDDQGDPQYARLTGPITAQDVAANGNPPNDAQATNQGSGTPGVVSVMRIVDRAGFIESGPFDVRIILTEDPMGGLTADKIMVENGSVMSVVKGASYKGGHPARDAITGYIPAADPLPAIDLPAVVKMDSQLGPSMVAYYHAAGDATAVVPATSPIPATTTATEDATGTVANFPQATGRDNMYHSYIARISPNAGLNGMVTVSVKAFDDNVLPVPNRYVPLTPEQRAAATLTGAAMVVRDARVKNESLSVRVSTAAAAKSLADLAKDAYDARQKELDAIGNEISLANKAYIPAGGYLVLVADAGKAGVNASSAKLEEKRTAAQKLYNTQGLGLPFPGDDLSNFFRNGGTLNLAYKDIPEATGSDHGDSVGDKSDTKDADKTGYTKANSTAYTKGTLLISEIMWGLDGATTDSQYIELHNPGTTAIGIDNKEWILTVGGAPTGWTVIDTVGNNPASGRWDVPGNDGVSKVEPDAGFFSLVDLVSMSRISDAAGTLAADGTAEASWAASMRPSANLSGRRIGTPGADNVYVEPAAPTPPPTPTPTPPTPAAEVGDLQITEVMVSTGASGLLPQWIEISNMSGATVSLRDWSINVDNDPGDATVAPSLNIILGDVDVGKDQAVLVVSKMSNRNSGVGTTAGMIRSDRIIDAKVGDGDAILSKMAFRIGLVPPLKAGAAGRGDVAGNLQQGWELPMAEGNARSSLIRRAMTTKGEVMGTDAAGWTLAENADGHLSAVPYETYYGDANDMGSPGLSTAGGALPVELSRFGAKRDALTGQVIITWETQSELNNAGFFIKRAEHKTAQFVPVNPTMIPGAGTTSEKQSYTYTDTTAKPNIVYYYQIEDVSLDGNRQTLTRAHRLKGHVGAAGKLTTMWGELKERE